jgi:Viral BACON domain/Putative binding domain, N-terminal
MGRPIAVWSATLVAALAIACGGSTEQELVAPTAAGRCQMSLVAPQVPAAGAQVAAQLSTTRDCAWSARTTAPWLQIEPTSGQGEATLTLTAAENPQGRNRSATVDINDQRFPVVQEAAPCRFEVNPAAVSLTYKGGRIFVQLTTLDGCNWATQSSQPWLRVVSPSGGDTSAKLELAVDSNLGAERSALLSVATLLVAVSQDAGPNDSSACRFSLGPGSRTIPAAGGTASFAVSTRPGCAWSVSSNQPWIAVLTSGSPIGPDTVHYRVEPNPSTAIRSGAITAGTRRHVVTQEAMPRP